MGSSDDGLHCSLIVSEERETSSEIVLLLFNLGGGSSGGRGRGGSRSSGGRGSSSGVGLRVGDHVLKLLSLLDGVVSSNGDGEDVLVGIDEQVGEGSDGGEVDLEGEGGNASNTSRDSRDDLGISDVEDLRLEDVSVIVDLKDGETIREGLDVEELEERSLRRTDLISDADDGDVGGDLNLTLGNLGRDVKSLQERSLSGLETSVTLRNGDIERRDGSRLSGSGDADLHKLITAVRQLLLGEDETNVTPDVLQENLDGRDLLQVITDGLTDESVLTHQDDSVSAGELTDTLELMRTDVVSIDEEDTRVLLNESLDALEEGDLLFLGHFGVSPFKYNTIKVNVSYHHLRACKISGIQLLALFSILSRFRIQFQPSILNNTIDATNLCLNMSSFRTIMHVAGRMTTLFDMYLLPSDSPSIASNTHP